MMHVTIGTTVSTCILSWSQRRLLTSLVSGAGIAISKFGEAEAFVLARHCVYQDVQMVHYEADCFRPLYTLASLDF